jgi:arylsulfatase A-like enzyme
MRPVAPVALALLALACGPPRRPGLPPEHVVLVTIGGLRADRMSCYGHRRPTTDLPSDPEARAEHRAMGLDDLASAGVLFRSAFAPSTSTVASLASLMTGLSPLASGVTGDGACLPEEVASLPELLAARGFETCAFVTSPALDLERALGRGFARFEVAATDEATLAAAARWAERDFGAGRRCFLWLHLGGVEPPWRTHPAGRFAAAGGPEAEGPALAARLERALRGEAPLDAADARRACDLYDDALHRTAVGLAWFLRAAFDYRSGRAEASETWARTALVVASPRGVELPADGALGHDGALCDEVLRVPLLLRHPDSLTGERVSAEVVELADVAPTVLDWIGVEPPAALRGRSLLARLDARARPRSGPPPAVASPGEGVLAVRTARWRLVWNPAAEPRAGVAPGVALRDLELDPRERSDVAARRPEVVAALQRAAARWLAAQPQRLPGPCDGPPAELPAR